VDEATIRYLEMAIEALKIAMGPEVETELELAKTDLRSFAKFQGRARHDEGMDKENQREEAYQKMADHLFSQVFRKLLSLINAHKDYLYSGFRKSRSSGNE
jgi:hypothetical protein